jgi:hypothetical protein
MHFIKKLFLLLSCGSILTVQAETIPVYKLGQAQGTYLETVITHDLYRYSSDARLKDVVVIDARGNKLPYRISAPDAQIAERVEQIPVRFFPVAVGTAPETLLALSSASIRLDANEISVSVEKSINEQLQDKAAPIDFYIVDLSDIKQRVDTLKINWTANESAQYVEVQVSGTNDLTNWTHLAQITLVQLQKDGQSLTRNKVPLNLTELQYAYLRVKSLGGGGQLHLSNVEIENTTKTAKPPIPDRWEVTGQVAADQDSALRVGTPSLSMPVAAWEYQRDDIAPVTRIGLQLGTVVYGDLARIYSRPDKKYPWQLVHQGIWFNTQIGSDWQHSDEFTLYNNSDMYWRVELHQQVRTTANPVLIFHRSPETLQFIANDAAPFQIAIETDPKLQNQNTNMQIFSALVSGKNPGWMEVNIEKLNPDIRQFARHGMQISWKTILFWSVLLIAVGVLVLLAAKLLKQVSRKFPGD